MDLRNTFLQSGAFTLRNNIFYQRERSNFENFETIYIALRKNEHRFYSDEFVRQLPAVPLKHPLRHEWRVRKFTAEKFLNYLPKEHETTILELGCGNGWLANLLATKGQAKVTGVDVNEAELLQASRVFSNSPNVLFVLADIMTASMPYNRFNYIVLAGSLQYFSDLRSLITRLLTLLGPAGEIHLLDSPLYHPDEVDSAHSRTVKYFSDAGFPEMAAYYHHHSWETLQPFHPEVLYNPNSVVNKLRRKFTAASPFPWIRMKARK
jgi:SAM-dependent methyltransferase